MYAWREIPGGADAYVDQWARSVEPLGLTNAPDSKEDLVREIDRFTSTNILRADETTQKVIGFIRNPGLPISIMPIYKLLFAAAVVSLSPEHRKMLNLRVLPAWLAVPLTRVTLKSLQVVIGYDSPIEEGALNRLSRLGLWK
jgi:hypothetical protein